MKSTRVIGIVGALVLLMPTTQAASLADCLRRLIRRTRPAADFMRKVEEALPSSALSLDRPIQNLFEGPTPEQSQIAFWINGTVDRSAQRVAPNLDIFRYSGSSGALLFDRESFEQIQAFENGRRGESYLENMGPSIWARLIDASYRIRVVESFADRVQFPPRTFDVTTMNRALRSDLTASSFHHRQWGDITVVKHRAHGEIVYAVLEQRNGVRFRLFIPLPRPFDVVRSSLERQSTDLMLITLDRISGSSIRLASAAPIFAGDVTRAQAMDRKDRQVQEALQSQNPIVMRLRELEPIAARLRDEVISYSTSFPSLFAWISKQVQFGLGVRTLQIAVGGAILGAFTYRENVPWGATIGAVVGSLVPSMVVAKSAWALRKENQRERIALALARRRELEEIERAIVLSQNELASSLLAQHDAELGRRYARFDFRFGLPSPGIETYYPTDPELSSYWLREHPNMLGGESRKILSLFQRAETTPLPSNAMKELVELLSKHEAHYGAAYEAAVLWFNEHFPLRRLETLKTFFTR